MGNCWVANSWISNSWIDGSWCPSTPPVPPTPVITRIEPRRWPGPSYVIYSEDWYFKRQQREEIEIIIL